jgi:hypothetical protein
VIPRTPFREGATPSRTRPQHGLRRRRRLRPCRSRFARPTPSTCKSWLRHWIVVAVDGNYGTETATSPRRHVGPSRQTGGLPPARNPLPRRRILGLERARGKPQSISHFIHYVRVCITIMTKLMSYKWDNMKVRVDRTVA